MGQQWCLPLSSGVCPPGPRDMWMALTPWKQLRVALSTEHRARLSPMTVGIYKRQETPRQRSRNGEIGGHQSCLSGGAYGHSVTSIWCPRLDELSQSRQTGHVWVLCGVWIEIMNEQVGRSGAGKRSEKKVWQWGKYREGLHCFSSFDPSQIFNLSLPLCTYELQGTTILYQSSGQF